MTAHVLHTITTAGFIRAIMRSVRHHRTRKPGRYTMTTKELADISGHNFSYINAWEQCGRAKRLRPVPSPTLHQALNCLEAVRR